MNDKDLLFFGSGSNRLNLEHSYCSIDIPLSRIRSNRPSMWSSTEPKSFNQPLTITRSRCDVIPSNRMIRSVLRGGNEFITSDDQRFSSFVAHSRDLNESTDFVVKRIYQVFRVSKLRSIVRVLKTEITHFVLFCARKHDIVSQWKYDFHLFCRFINVTLSYLYLLLLKWDLLIILIYDI